MANIMSTTGIFCCKGKFVNHQGARQPGYIFVVTFWIDFPQMHASLDLTMRDPASVQEVSGAIHLVCSFPDAFTFNIQPFTLQMLLCSHFVSFLFLCTFDLPFTFLPLESSCIKGLLKSSENNLLFLFF